MLYGDALERVVDLVLYPESEDHVRAIVRLAAEHNVCLVPYGGGTNVSGALAPARLATTASLPRSICGA